MFKKLFDYIDIYICSARYQKMWEQFRDKAERVYAKKMEKEPYYESVTMDLYKENDKLRRKIKLLNSRLRLRRAITQPVDQMVFFDSLKEKRLKRLNGMIPSNLIVASRDMSQIHQEADDSVG